MKHHNPEPQSKHASEGQPAEAQEKAAPPAEGGQKESLDSYKQKADNYYDQLLRLQAEFANFRKRTEKEKADAIRFGREAILERLISLLDVMEQALKHAQNASDAASLKKGFEMVVNEFHRLLKSEGVEPVDSVGRTFDPHLHEAIEQVETEKEDEHHKIMGELQKGYTFQGRLLRPARVKVARKASGQTPKNEPGDAPENKI